MAKRVTHSVNFVDFNNKDWPYKYTECHNETEAKLKFMDILLGFNETVTVEKMDNSHVVANLLERVEVKGETTHAIIAIQVL